MGVLAFRSSRFQSGRIKGGLIAKIIPHTSGRTIMNLIVGGRRVEWIKFAHLDEYDAYALYVNRPEAGEDDKPWCYLRSGSILTLCTLYIDGERMEGWSHKVPMDQPNRKKGNHLALARALRSMDRGWRKMFWEIYLDRRDHAAQSTGQEGHHGGEAETGSSKGAEAGTYREEGERSADQPPHQTHREEPIEQGTSGEVPILSEEVWTLEEGI